ncbi:hypothetical protein GCM10009710_35990 [Aeromicrobium alkaliterrae]|uniref:VWFA domain-containing protein n=1 Tax=Aeromicrobium alkaliterrae TaxID=302168 RepID=A0ABN2KCR3_9ACTN
MAGTIVVLVAACSGSGEAGPGPSTGPDREVSAPMPVSALEEAPPVPTVIVIDASGSMATEDAPGQRLQAAKDAVGEVVAGLPAGHEVGIVVYGTSTGGTPQEQVAGCQDVTVAVPLGPLRPRAVADQLGPLGPSGYTPIGLSLQVASAQLPGDGPRSIVVVSDGSDTCASAGLGPDPCDIAGALHRADADLTVSTIGFRSAADPEAAEQLGCMAREGGGQHLDAASGTLLSTRLSATLNAGWSGQALTPTSYRGLSLGMTIAEVTAADPDVSATIRSRGVVDVEIPTGTLTFTDGVLSAVTVDSPDVRTIDGLAVGDTRTDAERLYGSATTSGDGVTVAADGTGTTCFALELDGADTITAITLGACG